GVVVVVVLCVWVEGGACVVVVVVDCVVSCAITGSDSASTTSAPTTTTNSFLKFIRFSLNVTRDMMPKLRTDSGRGELLPSKASIGSLIYERNTVQNGS